MSEPRKAYPSDVSDEDWEFLAPYLALVREESPQRVHDLREVFNALRYVVKTGGQWRFLPHDFPPWQAVYQQARRWVIEKERESKVFLTVLGYGMGNLKNAQLEQLARHGNGHYAYIDSKQEAKKVFVEQGGALVCVAKDVKFQVEFNPAKVSAYRLIGYENRLLKDEYFKDDKKGAGDMGSGHTVTALYEVVPVGVKIDLPDVDPLKYQTPAKPAADTGEWLTVKMRYKQPEGEASKELASVLAAKVEQPMGEDFRFAAAVAEFGLVLQESLYKGEASLDAAIKRAEGAMQYDSNGHRAEFVQLVRKANELKK